jgi:outer membrane lipoprotein-sorting protein
VKITNFHILSTACALTCLAILLMTLPFRSLAGDKLKPEEVVARHLESIGTAEARRAVRTQIVGGTVVATFSSPSTGQFKGRAVIASEGSKNLLAMEFNTPNYSGENISFDGESVSIGYARAGVRSNLGDLVTTYKTIIKNGLVGGELSQAWPLFDLAEKKHKLEYRGTKKISGKTVHELGFTPRGGSEMEINLYFDSETFQHVRTQYTHVVVPQIGASVDASASQRTIRYKMIEDFSDFKKEGELTLPHGYKITLELDTRIPFRGNWDLTLNQFAFNQNIPPTMFNFGAKQ